MRRTLLQERSRVVAGREAALAVLEELAGREIPDDAVLALPDLADEVDRVRRSVADRGALAASGVHPQYAVIQAQRGRLEREAASLDVRARPRASAFGRLAYGRPGLQQFTKEFHDYWLAGVRLQWSPWDWGKQYSKTSSA